MPAMRAYRVTNYILKEEKEEKNISYLLFSECDSKLFDSILFDSIRF